MLMATIRQRRPGVWEVRGYTGKDVDGKSTQVSRTVHGTKKDAKLVAAELTVKPARNAGGRKLRQLLDEWVDIKTPGWADLTVRDQTSRAKQVAADPIGRKVFMAGDWFSYWPGWQVGALDSAHLATDMIARRVVSGG